MVLIERMLEGKSRTYRTSCTVSKGIVLVNLHPLIKHIQPSTMDVSGQAIIGVREQSMEEVRVICVEIPKLMYHDYLEARKVCIPDGNYVVCKPIILSSFTYIY